MIYYLLGLITGLIVSISIVIIAMLFKQPLNRIIDQTHSKFKERGKILEPESEELSNWINSLPKE